MKTLVHCAAAGLFVCVSPLALGAIVNVCSTDVASGGTNLAQALSAGGTVDIRCPANQPIRITRLHSVPPNTLINGNGSAVLDGAGYRGVLVVQNGGSLVLKRLTVRNFEGLRFRAPEPGYVGMGRIGGSISRGSDQLTLEEVTTENVNSAYLSKGAMTVVKSRFLRNQGTILSAGGALTLSDSVFVDNSGAAAFLTKGLIERSSFINNRGTPLYISYVEGPVEVRASQFAGTTGGPALRLTQRAKVNLATPVLIRSSTFAENQAGAIQVYDSVISHQHPPTRAVLERLPPSKVRLEYNRFMRNRGQQGAALDLDLANTGGLHLTAGQFVDNAATEQGGAISVRGGRLQLDHSVFQRNEAARGSALFSVPSAQLVIANSLVVRQKRQTTALEVGRGELVNVTIADNEGIGLVATTSNVIVRNSIISGNQAGNCRGLAPEAFIGPNAQFGRADCLGVPVQNPYFDRMYAPVAGSPILGLADTTVCALEPVRGRDLMFQLRPPKAACALGAYEKSPTQLARERRDLPSSVVVGPIPEALDGVSSRPLPYTSSAHDAALSALDAEAKVQARKSEIEFRRGVAQQRYFIERIGNDRLRYWTLNDHGEYEFIRVGMDVRWRANQSQWVAGPASDGAPSIPPFNAHELFGAGLRNAKDIGTRIVGGQSERVVEGGLEWTNGAIRSEGSVQLSIDVTTGLPKEMLFNGRCGREQCAFRQRFDYSTFTITLPTVP